MHPSCSIAFQLLFIRMSSGQETFSHGTATRAIRGSVVAPRVASFGPWRVYLAPPTLSLYSYLHPHDAQTTFGACQPGSRSSGRQARITAPNCLIGAHQSPCRGMSHDRL